MNKNRIKWSVAIFILLVLIILVFQGTRSISGLQPSSFDSPVATPVAPGPTPTPAMLRETQRALERIAAREGILVKQLVAVNLRQREYKLLGKTFWFVTAQNLEGDRWYSVMVNLADGSFVDDIETLEQAEQEAHFAKYGKLEPALFDRLESMKPDDQVMVAIWVVDSPKRSREELFAALAAKHPEARAALERSGKPFDVGDPRLANELEAEYVKMLEEDTLPLTQSLKDTLQAQGYTVITFGAMPAIAVTLPKDFILKIASRSDVGAIYLVGKQVKPELDTAVPTDRVPTVWQRGFKGSGVNIAILEPGKVDFTGPVGHNYLHQGQVRPCSEGEDWHKTLVASVAASYHGVYTGVAPEATVHDACTGNTDVDTVAGLSWATDRADPINFSAGSVGDGQLHFIDKAFDYWAFQGNDTVVKSAGNDGDYITSPGNGWNVITVGGSDDKGNANWSDDEWWSGSRWKNPISSDREKPEVVAPAKSITGIALDNATMTGDGTSFAAPQVTGLAALLINRNSDLTAWPEAVRAIIMASAMHNITGTSNIPTGQDLKDGAGGLDAALADTIAKTRSTSSTDPCTGPCWWRFGINSTNFPISTWQYRYFTASRGEHVRVAISWWSNADCPSQASCNFDRLDTNLNLTVFFPNGQYISSGSYDNNYELVDFTAPQTGQYKIGVYKLRADEDSNFLGIAWVKDTTYLPDLRNKDGWVSEFYVRNDGPVARNGDPQLQPQVSIQYFDPNGNPTVLDQCMLAPNQWCWIPVSDGGRIPPGATGLAIVDGGEDVSVVVTNRRYSGSWSKGAYIGIPVPKTSSTFYVPLLMHQLTTASGLGNSRVSVQNVNSSPVTVTTQFFNSAGSLSFTRLVVMGPNASDTYGLDDLPAEWYGSAVVSASGGGKIAVTWDLMTGADGRQIGNAFPAESVGTIWLVPLFTSRLSNGLSTPVTFQNLSGAQIPINGLTLSCSPDPGCTGCSALTVRNSIAIPNNTSYFFNPVVDTTNFPAGWYGSCRLTASGNGVSFVQMRYVGTGSANTAAYEAVNANGTARSLVFPLVAERPSSGGFATAVTIQNLSATREAHVTLTYWGSPNVGPLAFTIPASGSLIRNQRLPGTDGLPSGWTGSLSVTSNDQPIDGFIQLTDTTNPPGDTFMAHNAIAR